MTENQQRHRLSNTRRNQDEIEAEKEKTNPCMKENKLAMKCLDDNGYDRQKCEGHFENYKNCKKFWSWIQKHRKRQGIYPLLPPPEEREEVKQEFLPMLNKNFNKSS